MVNLKLMPIDHLMQEHRIIERMIPPIQNELSRIKETKTVNPEFINITIDFIRTYVDHCHHGKEEGILFRELAKKTLSSEHGTMMKELINEHVYARTTTANLEKAKDTYVNGNAEALNDVWKFLNDLAEFYPKHIKKEDKKFFIASMEYFTPREQETMLQEFWDFDRKLIHQKYTKTVAEMENML
jgi:hemerythrin-like domain-containing protein